MIFVTVGMHSQGFDRLIRKMDEIAGKIDEEVIMQIGRTKYKPKNAKYFDFLDFQKIKELNRKARLVICHGGAGSIITALRQERALITVPRLRKYREVIDNHQLELVEALAKEGKITTVYDVKNLEMVLLNSQFTSPPMKKRKDGWLVKSLRNYIINLEK